MEFCAIISMMLFFWFSIFNSDTSCMKHEPKPTSSFVDFFVYFELLLRDVHATNIVYNKTLTLVTLSFHSLQMDWKETKQTNKEKWIEINITNVLPLDASIQLCFSILFRACPPLMSYKYAKLCAAYEAFTAQIIECVRKFTLFDLLDVDRFCCMHFTHTKLKMQHTFSELLA